MIILTRQVRFLFLRARLFGRYDHFSVCVIILGEIVKTPVAKFQLIALTIGVCVSTTIVALAQPVTKARRITAAQFKPFTWPTYRQVAHSTPVPEVKAIQFLLRNQGLFKRQPDGIFHDYTAHTVRAFQRVKALQVDGIVGPQTWQPLLLRLKKGDRGDAVRALQIILRETRGHEAQYLTRDLPVDGIFGSQTEKTLRIAQEQANWFEQRAVVDGIAGPQIWSVLLDGRYQP